MPVANEIYDALCRIRIPGEARQVLDVIIRKTYGFQKKSDCIALSQFSLATGLSKIAVRKALNKLLTLNIITQKGNDVAKEYGIIKDYSLWKPLPKKVTLPKKVRVVTQKGNKRYPKRAPQKTKDTITKDIPAHAGEERPKYSTLGADLLRSFEKVDPKNKTYYGRTPQRQAADFLIEEYGFDKVMQVIELLPKSNKIPYFPKIYTPLQLKEHWQALSDAFQRKRGEQITKGRGLA